jgi:hypothetical protein
MPHIVLQSAPLLVARRALFSAFLFCFSSIALFAQSTQPSTSQPNASQNTSAKTAQSPLLRNITAGTEAEYLIRLINGDMMTGKILEILSKDAVEQELQAASKQNPSLKDKTAENISSEAIRFETALGTLTIFAAEIVEIIPRKQSYRHNHRLYIMPTAEPISGNAFIGVWELLFAYAGVGITDYVSLTAGRSLVPGILPSEQATVINCKITPYSTDIDDAGNRLFTCIGGNLALVNEANIFGHIFAGATFKGARTSITGQIFYKANEPSLYTIRGMNLFSFSTSYPRGVMGLGLGLDSRLSDRHDVHFIGELWNADLLRPSNSALLLGLRLCNTAIAMDFGVAIVAQPLAVPFVSFVWTPF